MSEILSGLNQQLAETQSQLAKNDREIEALKVSLSQWTAEKTRLENLLANAGWTVSAGKKTELANSINNANTRIASINAGLVTRANTKTTLNTQLSAIQRNINDYQAAVESSISQGIPESGSIALADDFVRAEMQAREKEMQLKADEESGKKLNRQIFVGVGIVVALVIVFFIFKKIKKRKK
jgi:chromosome segregation ATPase